MVYHSWDITHKLIPVIDAMNFLWQWTLPTLKQEHVFTLDTKEKFRTSALQFRSPHNKRKLWFLATGHEVCRITNDTAKWRKWTNSIFESKDLCSNSWHEYLIIILSEVNISECTCNDRLKHFSVRQLSNFSTFSWFFSIWMEIQEFPRPEKWKHQISGQFRMFQHP